MIQHQIQFISILILGRVNRIKPPVVERERESKLCRFVNTPNLRPGFRSKYRDHPNAGARNSKDSGVNVGF